MLSKLTLIGLHNYTEGKIWENIDLPLGIDKDILVNEILRANGEFPVIYPDPEFLKVQITYWSKKWKHNFERWIAAYNKQYEALYNVDVKTVVEEHGINSATGNKAASAYGSSNGQNGSLDTKSKAAYDASTFQNYEQNSGSANTSLSTSESSSESESHSESHDITTTETKAGNQGITMSQELLLAEYNAWLFNIYAQISDIFASEFCITLYA